jgi:acyl-coenzyme A synthetase/AMP-(fatty) acid ligase
MAATRLIAHDHPDAIVAWRNGEAISAGRFLADVTALAARLPAGGHLLNVCADRYRFAVGVGAALVARCVSLLPPAHTPEIVSGLREARPGLACLADADNDIALPQIRSPEPAGIAASPAAPFVVPEIDDAQLVAEVFTSGSTGTPQRHRKTWGLLVKNVRSEARRLGITDGRRWAILGTVPAQHMYGFETTVMMPLQSGNALVAGKPFYPADIADALSALPSPRVLVSTPFHLRTLLDAGIAVPPADLLVSATAPLSPALAAAAEAACGCPLIEIYGMTETGQLATRRSVDTDLWHTFDGIHLETQGEAVIAAGGHIEVPVAIGDCVELLDSTHFRLLGRGADIINIAGKRSSLAYLNHQLLAIPGVVDGAFVLPGDEPPDGVARLAALVVAPGMTTRQIAAALRQRIDPVFLPRPLLAVAALPRNATGKLPRAALLALLSGAERTDG